MACVHKTLCESEEVVSTSLMNI